MHSTNWGNLGHPGGYSSYDYGALVAEDRSVSRSKFSEIKLQTNFLKASPQYLTATPYPTSNGSYTNTPAIATSRLSSGKTDFYIVRHSKYNTQASTSYRLDVVTSTGNISVPQNGNLTLNGRDSKIHVFNYDLGDFTLLYSTAEIYTWKRWPMDKTVLLLYGGYNEAHEARFEDAGEHSILEGSGVVAAVHGNSVTLNWAITTERKVVRFSGGLYVYLLNREDAFNYWVLDLPAAAPIENYTSLNHSSIIVRGGYLLRSATIDSNTLSLTGDINATTRLEFIGGVFCNTSVFFNGHGLYKECDEKSDILSTWVSYVQPLLALPLLRELPWRFTDSLPEVQSSYDDSAWVRADHPTTNNSQRTLTTPISLYASDYGFHAGNLLTRGHFTATGHETYFFAETWGGFGYASAIYLNGTLLSGFAGKGANSTGLQNATLPKLEAGASYVLTILTDNMGLEEDFVVGGDQYKNPRGVVDYALGGRNQSEVAWRIAGNLGGEDYQDHARGPLNEGGLWAERRGYHLPGAPTDSWAARSPFKGIDRPGVGFFAATFVLDMPEGYDIPLAFVFANTTGASYRCQLYVNGYQYGKYVNNVGPQTRFPVPEGILNYHGHNYVALSLWGFDEGGNRLSGLDLVPTAQIMTGCKKVGNAPMPGWKKRENAY